MKFSIAATIALASFQVTARRTSEPLTGAALSESDVNGNSTGLEERGLFTKYPCTRGASIKLFKSHLCKGRATRTDIVNFPLPEGYEGRCQDVTSKSDMTGIKIDSPLWGYPSMGHWYIYSEPGCKGRSEDMKPSGLCTTIMAKKGDMNDVPIKSFKFAAGYPDKCETYSKDGTK